jgi:hypothetical protein
MIQSVTMESSETRKQIVQLLSGDFSMDEYHFLILQDGNRELREKVKSVIDHLLQSDFEKLLHIMYRLDIDESLFKAVVSGTYGNDVSGKLADIVLERELKKMETRKRYKDD